VNACLKEDKDKRALKRFIIEIFCKSKNITYTNKINVKRLVDKIDIPEFKNELNALINKREKAADITPRNAKTHHQTQVEYYCNDLTDKSR